jgi:Tfp pilus assembly protein PilF
MAHAEEVMLRKDHQAAALAYQDVLRANPKNITALTSLAGIRLQEAKYEEAEVMLQKCLVYDPENPVAFYRLGVSYFQQNRMDEAYTMFAKSVERKNDNARSRHYMGIIATKMGNRDKAEAEFKGALAIDPGYGDAHFNLAVLYVTSNPPNLVLARQHYQSALARGVKADPTMDKLMQENKGAAPTAKARQTAAAP